MYIIVAALEVHHHPELRTSAHNVLIMVDVSK